MSEAVPLLAAFVLGSTLVQVASPLASPLFLFTVKILPPSYSSSSQLPLLLSLTLFSRKACLVKLVTGFVLCVMLF